MLLKVFVRIIEAEMPDLVFLQPPKSTCCIDGLSAKIGVVGRVHRERIGINDRRKNNGLVGVFICY